MSPLRRSRKRRAYIVTGARVGTDGVIFTQRITVSKDGVRPAN